MTSSSTSNRPLLLPALILAIGMMAAAMIFGAWFASSRGARDTIQVTGAATVPFEADIVKWRVNLSRRVPLDGLQNGYNLIREDLDHLITRLTEAGISRDAIQLQPVSVNQEWGSGGGISGWSLRQSIFLVTESMDRIEEMAQNPGGLLRAGSILEGSFLEYFYSGIDVLKRELLSKATEDAHARASEIAGSSEGALSRLVSARAGVFQITEPLSTEVASYGIHNTTTRQKEITVTVHAVFALD